MSEWKHDRHVEPNDDCAICLIEAWAEARDEANDEAPAVQGEGSDQQTTDSEGV